jgi:hypothetical protein
MSEGAELYPPQVGPPQISRRKDQPRSPGTEEKISQASYPDPTVPLRQSQDFPARLRDLVSPPFFFHKAGISHLP